VIELRWDWDYLWHVLGGAAITVALIALGLKPAAVVYCVAIGGVAREMLQHGGRLTLHRWIEGLGWGVGALVTAFAQGAL
jgi:hypothetical protein